MASQVPNKKAPFRSPTWLSDAAKKRTGAPPQAFLDRLQFAREHPVEFQKELREKAVQAGQDPDAFAKSMAERNKTTRPVSLNLLAEVVNSPLVKEAQTATLQSEGSVDIPAMSRSLPQCSWTSPQPRLGTKGQITKLPQSKPDARDRRTSSASRTSSSMEMDQPHPIAESSASGPARMTESAGSSDTYAAAQPTAQLCPFPARSQLPNWHTSISQKSLVLLERQRPRPQALTAIDALKACIGRCEKNGLPKDFKDLRDYVHKAEIMLEMDKFKVRKTRILTGDGLPRIFGEDADFPWDLKADAWHLYERWVVEDFDNNILRGIVTVKAKDRNGDRLDSTYRNKHPRDPKVFGDNGAVLGQWWPSQLCAVRDGIHGAPQAGIYGDKERGAYSIVLSSGGYHDRDDGDTIEYSGTEGSGFEMTTATQSMITSSKVGNHVRVLRSSQLPKSNKYRPSCGLRYDGLYQVKGYTESNQERQSCRFHLERIPGQQPIRFEGETKRPTNFEEIAYDRCKGKI